MTRIDLTGQRFTRLIVTREAGRSKTGRVLWECLCDCGQVKIITSESLRTGRTKSCGCLNRELIIERSLNDRFIWALISPLKKLLK